ncbi:MAG: LptF/LptG family permease [Candidatus Magnetominusculus sp. LBB02]|nr:LptF/LptG family permease [Candidatus Magnetominusculus sp. LBB02]
MRVKIIHRYFFRELLISFVLSITAFNMILMMERILKFSMLLSGVGASAFDFIKIIVLVQPQLFLLTIPMSLMTAVLFTYGRLNADNEIIVLKAAGVSFSALTKPVFFFGLLCFCASAFNSFYLGPTTSKALRQDITNIIINKSPMAIKEGVFYTLFKNVVVLVREKPTERTMKDVFIYDKRDAQRHWTIAAKDGAINVYGEGGIEFILTDGEVFLPDNNSITKIAFKSYNMIINFNPESNSQISELTPFEILRRTKVTVGEERISVFLEFHRRLALPLLVLIISFFSPAFAMLSAKTGKLGGLSLAMVVFLAYYSMLIYFEKLARAGTIPHVVAGWTSFVILLICSIYFFRKENAR